MDACLACLQSLVLGINGVVRLAVREYDGYVGRVVAVALIEHLCADSTDGRGRVGRAARVAQVEGVNQRPSGVVLAQLDLDLQRVSCSECLG